MKTRVYETWVTLKDVAECLGMTVEGARKLSQVLPSKFRRTRGRRTEVQLGPAVRLARGRDKKRADHRAAVVRLEERRASARLKTATAARMELRLERDRGDVVLTSDVLALHDLALSGFREASVRLGRECGPHAQGILSTAVDDLGRTLERGGFLPPTSSAPPPPTAADGVS